VHFDHHTLVTSVNIKLKSSWKTDDVNTHMTYNVAQLTSTDLRFDLEVAGRCQLLLPQDNVSLLVSGLTVDILSTFCDGFMTRCAKLMLTELLSYL